MNFNHSAYLFIYLLTLQMYALKPRNYLIIYTFKSRDNLVYFRHSVILFWPSTSLTTNDRFLFVAIAFYLEKQKRFIPKKIFRPYYLNRQREFQQMAFAVPIFREGFGKDVQSQTLRTKNVLYLLWNHGWRKFQLGLFNHLGLKYSAPPATA